MSSARECGAHRAQSSRLGNSAPIRKAASVAFFSAADIAGREYIKGLMRGAGLAVRVDAAGNVIGRRNGSDSALPVIMMGSHIDSVPEGGNYDGDVGVLGAIEAATLLREHGVATPARFELATPCTPCKCATRLRHAPTLK